jgi:uncharacterized protein
MIENDILTQWRTARYTQVPFPPYRFIPGRNPHPIAHPQGHSYRLPGVEDPDVPFVPPEHWRESEAYLYGCDLYNHAYWWEAHEAWEGLWHHPTKGSAQREFLQGLIQVSACHLNLYLGRMDGVARLRQTSFEHFDRAMKLGAVGRYMGLDMREFMGRVEQYYDDVLGVESPVHRVEAFPFVRPR